MKSIKKLQRKLLDAVVAECLAKEAVGLRLCAYRNSRVATDPNVMRFFSELLKSIDNYAGCACYAADVQIEAMRAVEKNQKLNPQLYPVGKSQLKGGKQ